MIIFFGTSKNSLKFLEAMTKDSFKIGMVISAPPKPIGRKQIITENPVVAFAKTHKIPFHTALSFVPNDFKKNSNNLGLIFDYNRILPKEVIDLFSLGIVNIHFSKLPQYRGPAPVQATILNGDTTAWITYMLIDEKIDEGKILTQTSLPLNLKETSQSLTEKLLEKAIAETPKIIADFLSGNLQPFQQIGEPSYAGKLEIENTKINWQKPAIEIDRLICAAYPEPGAWTLLRPAEDGTSEGQAKRLKILKAHLEKEKLILDEVQLEGKNPVTWQQFLEGYPEFSFPAKV